MYIVKYKGEFGYIKPWTAVRDGITYSQQFLTSSIVEGIEKKLFPELLDVSGIRKICRHKLKYDSISVQQEQTQTRGWENKAKEGVMVRDQSVLKRGVMINPELLLGFQDYNDAKTASRQHICLCRNEDVMLPEENIEEISEEEFSVLDGFELRFGQSEHSFIVGYNRFNESEPMYGWIEIGGRSILSI